MLGSARLCVVLAAASKEAFIIRGETMRFSYLGMMRRGHSGDRHMGGRERGRKKSTLVRLQALHGHKLDTHTGAPRSRSAGLHLDGTRPENNQDQFFSSSFFIPFIPCCHVFKGLCTLFRFFKSIRKCDISSLNTFNKMFTNNVHNYIEQHHSLSKYFKLFALCISLKQT